MTLMACVLCGVEDHGVSVSLVEWREPIDGRRFDAVARCKDREACRRRVEASGEEWEAA